MTTRSIHSIKVFCSYAHKDEKLKNELRKHFVRTNISFWQDRDIGLGTDWADEIDKNLETADIVLLLISVDFLASKYCFEKEMTRALERHREEGIPVIPVLIRPVNWRNAPFSNLQASPASLLPVTRWIDEDEAFVEIASDVRREINKILKKKYIQDAKESIALAQYDMAYLEYRQALGYAPEDAVLHAEIGDLLVKLGRLEEALQEYEKAIELQPENDRFYIQKGHALSQSKRYEDALEAYQHAITLKKNDSMLYRAIGDTFSILKRTNEALEAYQQVLSLQPGDYQLYINMGNILFNVRRYQEALEAYETAEQLKNDDIQIYKYKGKTLLALERGSEAIVAYTRVISSQPENPIAYIDIGFAYDLLGEYGKALEAYEKALDLGDNHTQTWEHKGNVLVKLRRFEEAHDAYEEALLRTSPNESISSYKQETPHRLNISLEAYEHVIRLAPNNAIIHYQKGRILFLLKHYDDALIAQEKAINYDGHFAPAYLFKGLILQQLGKPLEALKAYMKGKELGYTG